MATVNPNHPAARAAPAAGEPPIPLVTYQQILQDMRVDRTNHEVGTALAQGAMDEPWSTVWKSFPTAALTALTADQYRGHVADSPTKVYSLVVRGGRIETVYGWRTCRPLALGGSRQAGLMGERKARGTAETPPKLVVIVAPLLTETVVNRHRQQTQTMVETNPSTAIRQRPTPTGLMLVPNRPLVTIATSDNAHYCGAPHYWDHQRLPHIRW